MVFEIKAGLNIPIAGRPIQAVTEGPAISTVGLLGDDYVGLRPAMLVNVGDRVKLGQPVFTDKKAAGVIYTAPGSGVVLAINRDSKQRLLSFVIRLEGNEQQVFDPRAGVADRASIAETLVQSGMWTAFRTRPFSKVPLPGTEPSSIFVTAMDTNPLAAEPELIIHSQKDLFVHGLAAVAKLSGGKTFVCTRDDSRVPGKNVPDVIFERFTGPHPAGLPGTHIHLLDPASAHNTVWHINYQDVIAIGHLFLTGRLMVERVIAVGGPQVIQPGLYKTRLGANLEELIGHNAQRVRARVISGSVLSGRQSKVPENYLGRYHLQVSVLHEGNQREFLGWLRIGAEKFSITRSYLGSWLSGKSFRMTTSMMGGRRPMIPVETYERVMPLDILPTPLFQALIAGNREQAQELGCLELAEEDLALCTFVCPSKFDYGKLLRDNLTLIEKEG